MSFHKTWNALQTGDYPVINKLFFQPTNKLTNKLAFSKAISWFQKAIVFLYEPKAQLLGKMKAQ